MATHSFNKSTSHEFFSKCNSVCTSFLVFITGRSIAYNKKISVFGIASIDLKNYQHNVPLSLSFFTYQFFQLSLKSSNFLVLVNSTSDPFYRRCRPIRSPFYLYLDSKDHLLKNRDFDVSPLLANDNAKDRRKLVSREPQAPKP